MRRDHLLWGVIILIFGSFIYFGVERWASIQKKEDQIEADRQSKIKASRLINKSLESSSLFGIRLGDSAIALRLSLEYGKPKSGNSWGSEHIDKIIEPTGLIKGTDINRLGSPGFTLRLNDFIDPSIHNDVLIYLNDDFEDYYIKYQPYNTGKIYSIFANLKTEGKLDTYETCIKRLRPYAVAVAERIKKENPFEEIVVEDRFYPRIDGEYNRPQIFFKNITFSKATPEFILIINGWCELGNNKPTLELIAQKNGVPYKKWEAIMKKIRDQKELDLKKEFNDDANKEKKIDKSGL
ncbi:hypothetical protein OAC07_03860 [Candidatus Pelagibacter sp.]|nr:hypothetical protein [Candidatus Pelagibacter sp.]